MPIYEYESPECLSHFEEKQSYDDPPVAICPRCRHKARRIFQAAPIIFKGSGFYITDHRDSSSSSSTSAPSSGKSPAKAAESKSEPAKKSNGAAKSDGK